MGHSPQRAGSRLAQSGAQTELRRDDTMDKETRFKGRRRSATTEGNAMNEHAIAYQATEAFGYAKEARMYRQWSEECAGISYMADAHWYIGQAERAEGGVVRAANRIIEALTIQGEAHA
jgi:hypothetical protein